MSEEEKKRDTTRVDFHTRAEIKVQDNKIEGEVENLSLTGMFLVTDTSGLSNVKNLEGMVTIRLAGAASDLSISLKGTIVRLTPRGVGVEFNEMEFDTFVHLRNIVAYNTGDEEKIMEEFSDTFDI